MRKLLLALPLLLTSCATPGALTKDQLDLLVVQIQTYTAQACAYQPTAASVATLIAAFYPGAAGAVAVANTIGDAICRAPVTSATTRRGATVVTRVVVTPSGQTVVIKGYGIRRGASPVNRVVQTPSGPVVVTGTAAR